MNNFYISYFFAFQNFLYSFLNFHIFHLSRGKCFQCFLLFNSLISFDFLDCHTSGVFLYIFHIWECILHMGNMTFIETKTTEWHCILWICANSFIPCYWLICCKLRDGNTKKKCNSYSSIQLEMMLAMDSVSWSLSQSSFHWKMDNSWCSWPSSNWLLSKFGGQKQDRVYGKLLLPVLLLI